jgi:hypothetical protein
MLQIAKILQKFYIKYYAGRQSSAGTDTRVLCTDPGADKND